MEINIYDFKISESRRIADFEEQYAGCDPDWENIERAAEKGIVAGALWFADLVAEKIHKGWGAAGLLDMCDKLNQLYPRRKDS